MSTPYPPGPQQPGGYPPPVGYGQSEPYGQAPYQGVPGAEGYLRGGPVSFGQAISLAYKHKFNYKGRAAPSAYWWLALYNAILYVVAFVIEAAATASARGAGPGVTPFELLGLLVMLAVIVNLILIGLPALVRRLHDTGRSGFWVFIYLVPFVGAIVLLVFTVMPGTPGPNQYG